MNHPKNISWVARDTRIKFWHRFFKSVPGRETIKTQIVYESGINFHTVVPYLELITRNGLAERTEGEVLRYKTTAKGTKRSAFQGAEETTPERMLRLLKGWRNYIGLQSSRSSRMWIS